MASSTSPSDIPPAALHIAAHLRALHDAHTSHYTDGEDADIRDLPVAPLFVGVQGPQGSGKSYLTSWIPRILADPALAASNNAHVSTTAEILAGKTAKPRPLRTIVLSLDDFYFPHHILEARASSGPPNPLLRGRGMPGTHDTPLLEEVLSALKGINGAHAGPVLLPSYDKSAHDGRGDRAPAEEWECVAPPSSTLDQPSSSTPDKHDAAEKHVPPVDIVVLEGWCVGFYAVSEQAVHDSWPRESWSDDEVYDDARGELRDGAAAQGRAIPLPRTARFPPGTTPAHVCEVNAHLREDGYARVWGILRGFVTLTPPEPTPSSGPEFMEVSDAQTRTEHALRTLATVYRWRTQQELAMLARNGGKGMDVAGGDVVRFVDRYIPGYVFFGDGVRLGEWRDTLGRIPPPWAGRGLAITLGLRREVVGVERF
ncbi:hypothetical protein PLICRDRAFT_169281 [Plicaturopsis crispa FD-325 SS-3]|nr:hypothetical protein PLICRDRAFT_169281 [Plicaturopsis crispa FD-325 SS-3]